MWSCQKKKENKSISNPLIKKTINNDFYTQIQFNSYGREAAAKQNKKCSQHKAQALNTPFCNHFRSEASDIFCWPSPLSAYSKKQESAKSFFSCCQCHNFNLEREERSCFQNIYLQEDSIFLQ